jgi:hypothetical protein
MKTITTLCLLTSSFLLVATAQAQTTFSVGPRVGLNVTSVHYPEANGSSYTGRAGFEAGLTSNVQFGHFALQPSVLFSQKGYKASGRLVSFDIPVTYEGEVRLNYLTVPLNLVFTLGREGQGLQVFGGPYASLLVGGNYTQQTHFGSYLGDPPYDAETSGKLKPADVVTDGRNRYARRFDTGLQAGIGYRLGGFQLQAGYSLGLRNLASQYRDVAGNTYSLPSYYNRAWQVSLSYLVRKS